MKTTKTGVLILTAVFFSAAVCRAQNSVLKRGYAFAKAASYGKELKDFDGTPAKRPDSLYFLYLEIKGTAKPKISSVSANGQRFTASVVPVTEKKLNVGNQSANGKALTIERSTGYSFWRIELTLEAGKAVISSKGISVKGTTGKSSFTFSTPKWTVLTADLMG